MVMETKCFTRVSDVDNLYSGAYQNNCCKVTDNIILTSFVTVQHHHNDILSDTLKNSSEYSSAFWEAPLHTKYANDDAASGI